MSDLQATLTKEPNGSLTVTGYESLKYNFHYTSPVFDVANKKLAEIYEKWGRVLIVIDTIVHPIYQSTIETYFKHYGIPITWKVVAGGELNKTMDTMLEIVDAMDSFGIVRTEPTLVIGGGLVTDVAGYACASYRRTSNFIRIPTTLIGLIDASVSIKVAVNHRKLKNRLGAYHAPLHTFLDFSFLRTLPVGQIRNGFAELIKIASVGDKPVWELLVKHGKELVETGFGHKDGGESVKAPGLEVCHRGIETMLQLESPNLHEIGLDRVIAFGHTWSPTLELTPRIPLRHGHAITIDMAYSITLAHSRGLINDVQRDEWFHLISSVGLSMDHEAFDEQLIEAATEAIKKTRDGKQRFAVPDGEFGKCLFLNDVPLSELKSILKVHKDFVKSRYGSGDGLEAYVDAGDLGADPEKYAAKGQPKDTADSLKRNGIEGVKVKTAAVAAGAVPIDGTGHVVNGMTATRVAA
ncbi:hypothetical protein BD324DRAFT_648899 [Kockovaella imperatae]|uniref:Uncharacterized protein n=1 Tax=Kockovaella imperatae TaxID=4999 RepID=A0A1Y1US86_9TREE|nr:hypothetical protein BD324DRAFT_648899 [Kockovaella imperatae]ORX40316.1 hypothetical protein BD324DRAFT_648899 [Kockovaella imperatae]